jgi:hypothetical protein
VARKRPPGCRPGRIELRPTLATGVAWASGCSWPGIFSADETIVRRLDMGGSELKVLVTGNRGYIGL